MAPTSISQQMDIHTDSVSYQPFSSPMGLGSAPESPEPPRGVDDFISTLLQAVTEDDDHDTSHTGSLVTNGSASVSVPSGNTGHLGLAPVGTAPRCTSCEESSTATSRCGDCSEMLCDPCVKAHQRVRLTKDHHIIRFDEARRSLCGSQASSSSPCSSGGGLATSPGAGTGPLAGYCEQHGEPLRLYCEGCPGSACGECALTEHRGHPMTYLQDAIDNARNQSMQLLADARQGIQAVRDSLDSVQHISEAISIRCQQVTTEIQSFFRKLVATIEEREHELISRCEQIRHMKGKALMIQSENLRVALGRLVRITNILNETLESSTGLELLSANEKSASELKQLRSIRSSLKPCEEATIEFVQPGNSVLKALINFGYVSSVPSPNNQGTKQPQVYPSQKNLILKEPRLLMNGDLNLLDRDFSTAGIKSCTIYGTSNPVVVRCPRSPQPSLIFGSEGENDGELCRPWGICCDKNGNIIVADRSNNRIQVFNPDGSFRNKFGEQGTGPGEFDRPASVVVDPLNRVIVTDKDNHRVQIFTIEGNFIMMFGEKGCRNGQFNYPWDLAVNSKGQIVISDTRNHRIQLFSYTGQFLNKYGFEGSATMWKHFDSPRGVTFNPSGDIIVTDFNNHRLVIIDPSFVNAQFLGCEGTGPKQFMRPQGICSDDEGRILVADSRNSRIQIFEPNGNFLYKLGTPGKNPGELDRPSGICLNPKGQIVVIDFGNNRVQVF